MRDRKLLWGKAGNKCAFVGCHKKLIEFAAPSSKTDVVVGEEAHIVAESDIGPRAEPTWSQEQRDAYPNRVLLCSEHHTIVDKAVSVWTVAKLHALKDAHELAMAKEVDWGKQRVDEVWGGLIDDFVQRAELQDWAANLSGFVQANQGARFSTLSMLREVTVWISNRIWPPGHPEIIRCLETFSAVATDLVDVFDRYGEAVASNSTDDWFIRTEKFYKRGGYPTPGYHDLAEQYDRHVDLVSDLALELNRCANWFADIVRAEVDVTFMMQEGVFQLLGGPFENGYELWLSAFYSPDDVALPSGPYTTLDEFKKNRYKRDLHSKPPVP